MKKLSKLLLFSLALALTFTSPAFAYDISATATNNTGSAKQGQKLTLYGGQTILDQSSSGGPFNRFTAAVGATATALNYGFILSTDSVANGGTGSIFVRTGGSSALVKSWTWTNSSFTPLAAISTVSGTVSGAASPSSGTEGFALMARESFEEVPNQPRETAVDWTFYNGTTETFTLDFVSFFFEDREGNTPNQESEPTPIFERRGSDTFGGAKDNEEGTVMPPSGGAIFHLSSLPPPDSQGLQRWLLAEGAVTNMQGETTTFAHANPLADVCHSKDKVKSLGFWHMKVNRYMNATSRTQLEGRAAIKAEGDVQFSLGQAVLDELKDNIPGFESPSMQDLLSKPLGHKDRARKELAALIMNIVTNRVCGNQEVRVGGETMTITEILEQAAADIASGDPERETAARKLLQKINSGDTNIRTR